MAYIKYKNSTKLIKGQVLPISPNVVRITSDVPPSFEGFSLFLDEKGKYPLDNGEYAGYTTLYRTGEGWNELSNDGSVYEEIQTVIPEDLPEKQREDLEKRQRVVAIQGQIASLKAQISQTDYQVIKSYEYSLVGKEAEYDMEALHAERQNLRNQINELEQQMVELTAENTTE
ncbi:MAG: hypothetical protein IJF07_08695 [Lachnospiraceae bacterium]|nr:hypothetical protein [Lachnospiraceae bacterium]